MKALTSVAVAFYLLILSYIGTAQTIIDIQTLKSELDTISAQQLPINSIALTPQGNWVVLYGDVGYTFIDLPSNIVEKLSKLNQEEKLLKDIDFQKNSKTLLFEDNGWWADSVSETLKTALKMINNNGKTNICLDFSYDGAWVLLYDDNRYVQNNAPASLIKKMDNLIDREQIVKHIAFSKKGWIILYAFSGFSYSDIPSDVSEKIDNLYKENHELNKVFFLGDYWVVVYDGYKYVSNF